MLLLLVVLLAVLVAVPVSTASVSENQKISIVGRQTQIFGEDVGAPLTNITLRGGVLLAPPFAIYDDDTKSYTGFQGDLLKSLEIFALLDGYHTI